MEIDNEFAPSERLFLRLHPEHFSNRHTDPPRVLVGAVRFPDFSVNRGKYSEPEDVLAPHWPKWGISAFRVDHVPPSLSWEDGRTYDFRVEHVPEEHNYAHSEVRTYKDGERGHEPNKVLKMKFRAILAERMEILKEPEAA